MDYVTLRALAAEWDRALRGAAIAEAFTQERDEARLVVHAVDGVWTLRARCTPNRPLLFRTEGTGRARRNTAAVLPGAAGRQIEAVRVADRDRFFALDLEGGGCLLLRMFGPHPNGWRVGLDGRVAEVFLGEEGIGEAPPQPQPAPDPETPEAFAARWRTDRPTVAQAIASAVPLLGAVLAADVARRAGVDPRTPPGSPEDDSLRQVFAAVEAVRAALAHPHPHLYRRGQLVEALTPIPLAHPPEGWTAEAFETMDAAVRAFARRTLAQRRFEGLYRPLEQALATAAERLSRRADAMLGELQNPSRADRYEAWGHLLMAQAAGEGPGRPEITLPDILGEGAAVTIPLDPAQSAVENAQRMYAKARQARQARAHAEARWAEVQADADRARALLGRLRTLDDARAVERFREEEHEALARLLRPEDTGEEARPYRRVLLDGGWEVRIGKHARSNAELTAKHAAPHDLWLHARGVPGAHVVLRKPSKTAVPPKSVVEEAAALAAHFSQAKTQALVPVIVTERKYVRPLKGGAPGQVRVDREEVLMVAPRAPDGQRASA